jgi:hypothetical protein
MSTTEAADSRARPYSQPGHYPVNIRVSIPFLPRRIFITLIIGPERRGRERLKAERELCPLGTWGNMATLVSGWTVFIVAALFAAFVVAAL